MQANKTNRNGLVLIRGAVSDRGATGQGPCGRRRRSDRETKRAGILDDQQIDRVLAHIEQTSNSPRSDELKVLLSFYAGLRVAEIAGMTVDNMLDVEGRIHKQIYVSKHIAKRKRARTIPMHPKIRSALARFQAAHPDVNFVAFSNRHGVRRQNAGALKSWFSRIYQEVGLTGCSSHSGRRTFVTRLARIANEHHQSLRDVQALAGHSRLESTAAYVEPSDDTYALIASLGSPATRRAA